MRINSSKDVLVGLMSVLLISSVLIAAPASQAQSSSSWSNPVNLSNAGSSTVPSVVTDSSGVTHVIWLDEFDGYKYAKTTDGVAWTEPKQVRLPFTPQDEAQPVFLSGQNDEMHVFWLDRLSTLHYSKVTSEPDNPARWSGTRRLTDGVVDFHATISPQGVLHVGYVTVLAVRNSPIGVYYLNATKNIWSRPQNLYTSQYFRSVQPETANIRVAVSAVNDVETVYLVWDDRSQKQILMAKSLDGGTLWEESTVVRGSESTPGLETPFNVNIGAAGNKVLLLWQSGIPGAQCGQYSQWSTDGGKEFGPPEKILDQFDACPQVSELVAVNEDYSVVWLNILNDVSLVAWNGSSWSEPQSQYDATTFPNPVTLDSVFLGCQNFSFYDGQLGLVGCDTGASGDIWFTSRSLGTLKDWFPPSTEWSSPVELTNVEQEIAALSSVADNKNNMHSLWVQTPIVNGAPGRATIQYAGWNGETWSSPVTVVSNLEPGLTQIGVKADSQNRLLLTWVNNKTGDLAFSWANLEQASKASEWKRPQFLPSTSQANSAPAILADDTGKILVAYAVSINEHRGIYFVTSDDDGANWTQPYQVFDAEAAAWDIVDQPSVTLTGDGRLHVLFRRYSWRAEQRQSLGLYYSQSADGGATWSDPEVVSEHPILWSAIFGYGTSTLHRLWQENNQSTFLSLHQISQDGGVTWSSPIIISSVNANSTSLMAQTMDQAGNLHLLELAGQDHPMISDQVWNGSQWSSEKVKELYVRDHGIPSAIAGSISSDGNLLLSVVVDFPPAIDQVAHGILSVDKSFNLPEDLPASLPYVIASQPVAASTAGPSEVVSSSTQTSPLDNLSDPQASLEKNKNIVGLLLVGGVLILIILIFRPIARRQNRVENSQ